MRPKRQSNENDGPKVPAYIVTYSDMVTLLLTFFVMLLTLASEQDPELFAKSRDSFIEDLNHVGLGMLFGTKGRPDFGKAKLKYHIDSPDEEADARTINAQEEKRRRLFHTVSRSMDTMKSRIEAERTDFQITDIRFPPGDSRLDLSARQFIEDYTAHLLQDIESGQIKLYVLGLAPDIQTPKRQWAESAQRAQSVVDHIKTLMPRHFDCPVFGWGAGPGTRWLEHNPLTTEAPQILIGVMRLGVPLPDPAR